MQDCSLCKRRQCLVQTVDHHICSQIICAPRKCRMKSEMRSMCFIYDQWNPIRMCHFCNSFHIRYHAIIIWRYDHNGFDIRLCSKCFCHIFFADLPVHMHGNIKFRIHIARYKTIHINCMVNGFVTMACHQNLISPVRTSHHCT